VKRFFQPFQRVGFNPTLVQKQFNYRDFRVELKSEEEAWLEKQEEKKYVLLHEQSDKPKASVS
jgi:hypothetical protein